MPKLEYALIAEHVRTEAGLSHIIAAGIDTVVTEQVPAPWNVALLLSFRFAESEAGEVTPLQVTFKRGRQRLAQVQAEVTTEERPADLPADWPTRTVVALNMGIVLPEYGIYRIDISIGGRVRQSLPFRVVAPVQPDAPA